MGHWGRPTVSFLEGVKYSFCGAKEVVTRRDEQLVIIPISFWLNAARTTDSP